MTNDEAAFLAAIVERPDDDLPRLVFADWLEEHGRIERAEFIRVQCEIPRLEEVLKKPYEDQDLCTGISASWCPTCGDCCCVRPEDRRDDASCPLHAPTSRHAGDGHGIGAVLRDLRRRERELLKGATKFDCGITERTVDDMDGLYWLPGWPLPPTDARWKFRRGFVEEVTTPWSYDRVAALRKVTPLRKCVLIGAWPKMEPPPGTPPDLEPAPVQLVGGNHQGVWVIGETARVVILRLLAAEFPGTVFELP